MTDNFHNVLFWDDIKKTAKVEEANMSAVKPIDEINTSSIDVGALIDHMFGTADEREAQSAHDSIISEGGFSLGNTGDNLGEMLCVTDAQAKRDLQIIQSVSN